MNQDYWKIQKSGTLLFPDIEWSRPERAAARGKLLVVGGSKHGFAAVGKAFATATETGAGQVKVAAPDILKNNLPKGFDNGVFLPTNPGGGLGIAGREALVAAAEWADGLLLVGDSGMNSETALLFEGLLATQSQWVTITRDAVDLVLNMGERLVNRPNMHLVMTFTQAQKLFQKIYYPRPLLFSQQLSNVVESLHKFTITYPATITLLHQENLIAARDGAVVTQKFTDQFKLIDGAIATRAATCLLWNTAKPLEAIASSWQM